MILSFHEILKNPVSTVYMRTGAPYLCSDELISLSLKTSLETLICTDLFQTHLLLSSACAQWMDHLQIFEQSTEDGE